MFTRDIEVDTVPVARELGIGIVPYSPLGRGWLDRGVRSAEEHQGVQSRHPRFGADVFDHNRALAPTP